MKTSGLLFLVLLAGCRLLHPYADSDHPTEASSMSSAASKRLGVFLRDYAIASASDYLNIKEAYVEEPFWMSGNPERVIRLDTTTHVANLIIVLAKEPKLGTESIDWYMSLADRVSLDSRQGVSFSEWISPTVYRFRLKHFKPEDSPSYPMRLHLKHGGVTNAAKDIDLLATPL